jgi:hypothetical protein
MSHTKIALISGFIIICGVASFTALPVYREYMDMVTAPDVTNNTSPYHVVADMATTIDRLMSQLCEISGWDRIVIFSPYQDEKSFRSVGITNSKLIKKLATLAVIRENWHLVAIDEDARIIDAQIVGWDFVPETNKGVIILDRSDCK